MPGAGLGARRILGKHHTGGENIGIEPGVFGGIGNIRAAAQHRRRDAAGAKRSLMGRGVDAPGQAGDHQSALPGQGIAEMLRRAETVGRAAAGAHHGDGSLVIEGGHGPLAVEQQRRVENIAQALGVERIVEGEDEHILPGAAVQNGQGLI